MEENYANKYVLQTQLTNVYIGNTNLYYKVGIVAIYFLIPLAAVLLLTVAVLFNESINY